MLVRLSRMILGFDTDIVVLFKFPSEGDIATICMVQARSAKKRGFRCLFEIVRHLLGCLARQVPLNEKTI